MIYFLEGNIDVITPTSIIINCNGIGYKATISLQTFTQFQNQKNIRLLTEPIIREDAHLLFGFSTEDERNFFRLLISVNGVGPSSAIMLLSTLSLDEIASSIASNNSAQLQKVKGIGLKTAQRIIVDLQDKLSHFSSSEQNSFVLSENKIKNDALSALEALGISKKLTEKVVDKIIDTQPNLELEELIKQVLKKL